MNPRIETLPQKQLVGKKLRMSFSDNQTKTLWQGFMPRRAEITNGIGPELYSLEVYPPGFFNDFRADMPFDKWAAVEVVDLVIIPYGMEALTVPAGLYAVFSYRGPASEAAGTYRHIFETWVPDSIYAVDERPHFAVMGDKYRHEHRDSEEEIWIPVRPK